MSATVKAATVALAMLCAAPAWLYGAPRVEDDITPVWQSARSGSAPPCTTITRIGAGDNEACSALPITSLTLAGVALQTGDVLNVWVMDLSGGTFGPNEPTSVTWGASSLTMTTNASNFVGDFGWSVSGWTMTAGGNATNTITATIDAADVVNETALVAEIVRGSITTITALGSNDDAFGIPIEWGVTPSTAGCQMMSLAFVVNADPGADDVATWDSGFLEGINITIPIGGSCTVANLIFKTGYKISASGNSPITVGQSGWSGAAEWAGASIQFKP